MMPSLTAPSLFADPRVEQAKRLLLQAVADHQKSITGIRPPDPELKISYDGAIAHFAQSRGGPLFYPYLGSGIGNGMGRGLGNGKGKGG